MQYEQSGRSGKDNGRRESRDASGYSRYRDPSLFPRFGGDELDPPPYATDRRSVEPAPHAEPRRRRGRLARIAEAGRAIPNYIFRTWSTGSFSILPR